MNHKFLYIDDLDRYNANGIILALEATSQIKIIYSNPKGDWEEEIIRLIEQAKDYQGIILDLRLQEKMNETGKFSKYSGAILAHHFRESVKSGDSSIKDIPLILLSGNSNLQKYFDNTGKDAFDLCVSRDDLNEDKAFAILIKKLCALAEGYIKINSNAKEIGIILNISKDQLSTIDERFQYKIKSLLSAATHDLAKFIIQEFLEKEGLVISEYLLAARLGIDIHQSTDWKKLLKELAICKYDGVFSGGWDRWWMSSLQNWWSDNLGESNLRSISATERVRLLKEKFNLEELVSMPKIEKARSDSFWLLCSGLKRPLDPIDGLLVAGQDDSFPWQEKKYVSYDAAIKSISIDEWYEVTASEKNKLDQLKTIYSNERIRR
jgi:hypothetical protein